MNFSGEQHQHQKPVFSILILTIGIPGAGKTTWVNQYVQKHPYAHVISTDSIRKELTGKVECDPAQNEWVHGEARRRVKEILDNPNSSIGMGPEIIVDSTNVDVEEWIAYKKLGSSVILAKVFDTDVNTAMKYQEQRRRFVPRFVLEQKWTTLQKNKKFLPLVFNMLI